jgi:hypothetical protein
MSGTDQLISIDAEDPKYYAELLRKIPRPANSRLPSDGESGSIQDVDIALTRRLQTLLDAVADISLCRRGNVSAAMASLKDNADTLETQLYIVFNHDDDESAGDCSQHLQNILTMLRKVTYIPPALGGSPKIIAKQLEDSYIEICQAIHDYSFEVFLHRVTKRAHKLSEIRGYIEQDQTDYFSDRERRLLLEFLEDVDLIITTTTTMTSDHFSATYIKMLLKTHTFWTRHGLLPKDPPTDKKLILLDKADTWLAESA